MRTDEELKQIAQDIYENKIFTSSHCRTTDEVCMSFMPLILMPQEQLERMRDGKITLIYEYYEEALPRSVNGLPIFPSFQSLNEEETKRMEVFLRKIKQAVLDALGEEKR